MRPPATVPAGLGKSSRLLRRTDGHVGGQRRLSAHPRRDPTVRRTGRKATPDLLTLCSPVRRRARSWSGILPWRATAEQPGQKGNERCGELRVRVQHVCAPAVSFSLPRPSHEGLARTFQPAPEARAADGCARRRRRCDCRRRRARWHPPLPQLDSRRGALRARVATPADYLFASPALAERLRRCVAFNPTEWYAFSDQSPIVATFEV